MYLCQLLERETIYTLTCHLLTRLEKSFNWYSRYKYSGYYLSFILFHLNRFRPHLKTCSHSQTDNSYSYPHHPSYHHQCRKKEKKENWFGVRISDFGQWAGCRVPKFQLSTSPTSSLLRIPHLPWNIGLVNYWFLEENVETLFILSQGMSSNPRNEKQEIN
jgi:hypothetical protein